MSSQIDIIAILFPKPGKADRIVELLNEVSGYVKANEPGTLKYQVTRGKDEVIMIESYKDKAALGDHGSSKTFKSFQKQMQEEDLVARPMQLKMLKDAGGFASRL
ncbi:hypothetical protein WAI453_005477 [Rhynchosporium graminicola]|uniref:ABM domain-containing protein n=1 Tax=Rhynchosporium graminicola TaxID=2792576 RepID=A0A1E1L3V0_9HELO|nr:uncharacterized protein RCO7_05357 [Rhynchosporium commune]